MAKKVAGYLKLQVPAGAANPSPPIGPALGQRGINIMEFCKAFNAQSQEMEKGSPDPGRDHLLPGQVVHLPDEDAAGRLLPEEGGEPPEGQPDARPRHRPARSRSAQVREIAEKKMKDLNANTVEGAMKMVAGSARSMGIEVTE